MASNPNNLPVPVTARPIAKRKKLKKLPIKLKRTQAYIKQIQKMKPEECYKLQMDQLDALILANKEAAIDALERCQEGGDPYALEEYKHYVAAALVLSQDKARLAEFYSIAFPNLGKKAPEPFKAPQLTSDEWEKKFKPLVKQEVQAPPQQPAKPSPDPANLFVGPVDSAKEVN